MLEPKLLSAEAASDAAAAAGPSIAAASDWSGSDGRLAAVASSPPSVES